MASSAYYPGKYTYTGLCYLSKAFTEGTRPALSATTQTRLVDGAPVFVMTINRPWADPLSVGIVHCDRVVHHIDASKDLIGWRGTPIYISLIGCDARATHSVYEHPTLNTKESPHYAAAMILNDRMVSFVWFGGKVFVTETSSAMALADVYASFVLDCKQHRQIRVHVVADKL